jgi:hypothetical protein
MIFLITLTIWVTITVLIVGLCLAARLGDLLEQGALGPEPDRHAGRRRRRTATLPGRFDSLRHLSTR